MKIEDYNEYYIQGSDHYLIPKDAFMELFNEMINWKEENKILKENAENNDKVVDKVNWENMLLKKENEQLKKQVDEYKKLGFKYLQDKNNNLEIQQKEFIEYMNKTIEELEYDDVDDEEMKGYLIQRIDTFKEILSKYKSIIGGNDDNK